MFDPNEAYPYKVEGVGASFIPEILDFKIIDGLFKFTDKQAALETVSIAKTEGLLLGNSAGALLSTVKMNAHLFKSEDLVVLLPNDTGARYLSKVHDPEWMSEHRYTQKKALTAIDFVKDTSKDVISVKTTELVAHAVDRMRKYKISQIPVSDYQGFVGSVDEVSLLKAFLDDHRKNDTPIKDIMNPPFPMVNSFASIEEVTDLIRKGNTAIIVAMDNEKHGIITKSDVISRIQ